MRIRRLRILGVAMGLSAVAALIGLVFYLLPRESAPSLNRTADFVAVNQARSFIDDTAPLAAVFRFPNRDDENADLRLIAIDEASMNDPHDIANPGLGAFPWKRAIYGRLLQRLHKAGAKVVAFDVEFFDPSADPADDRAFADGMRAQRTILAESLNITSGGILRAQTPPPELASEAYRLGSTSTDDVGGWFVGQPVAIDAIDGANRVSYASLAGATASAFLDKPLRSVDPWRAQLGDSRIPLDGSHVMLMVPFTTIEHVQQARSGSAGPTVRPGALEQMASFFQPVSFVDALKLDDRSLAHFARGKIVVIGSTAQALGDYVVTPSGRSPGVFANLRLIDQLVRGRFVARFPPALDILAIVLIPLLIGFVVTQLRPSASVAIGLAVVVLYSVGAIALYGYTLHWMNLVQVDGATILAALFVAMYRTATEGADNRRIRDMFGKHLSKALVDQMLSQDDPLKALALAGKRVKVTIFYSDIRGFTSMSEKMTPEEIYGALNEYFEAMCHIVFAYGGYIDKFIGDCVMAVFSAPNPQPGDADNAVRSAWEQQQKILSMMTEWAAQGRQVFTVGMGLNTGEVVMGNLGSKDRLEYTVIGDSVNIASRLYNVAKGGQIIISESTYEEVKDRFIVNELAPVFVKGKTHALRNFEVIGLLEPGFENTSRLLDSANPPAPTVADAH